MPLFVRFLVDGWDSDTEHRSKPIRDEYRGCLKDGMSRVPSWPGCRPRAAGAGSPRRELEEAAVTIVMGLDQHRAQITAEWLDTETGEVSRARVLPADRTGVRRFLARFAGRRLAVFLQHLTDGLAQRAHLIRAGADDVAGHNRGRGLAQGAGFDVMGEIRDLAVGHFNVDSHGGTAQLGMRGCGSIRRGQTA